MVDFIDFSCKKNVLIKNPDGTYSSMDEPFFWSKEVAPQTWQILSSGDYCYLIAGEQQAIAIDTGYGAGNIRQYMQSLTDKPLRDVINTHDHFDHTAGNAYFDHAYMGRETLPLATIPFASFSGIDFHEQEYERVVIDEGDVLDIGGRSLEVFKIPDHAPGSIALLDRKERLLFTGDEFMIMGKRLRVGLSTFKRYIEKLYAHRKYFDRLLGGGAILDGDVIDRYKACIEYIMEGHEGVVIQEQKVTPPLYEDPEGKGRIVYDRQMPHPGDGGLKKKTDEEKNMRCMVYEGVRLIYDRTRVDE